MKAILCIVVTVLACDGINSLLLPGREYGRHSSGPPSASWFSRHSRNPTPYYHVIDPDEDCFLVKADEGEVFFKSPSDEPGVCGIFLIADPDKRIQVTFNYLDVPCDNGGLVAWIDGWELSGQVWPADSWDDDRVVETCGQRPQRKLISRQNAALIQYRVPAQGKGFAVTIRHLRNIRPCNVMLSSSEGVVTLRNHGETGNCSVVAVSPATVRILDLDVGQSMKGTTLLGIETGTINHCKKRGLPDYVEVGGSVGLDHTKMKVLQSVCGLDSCDDSRPSYVVCENTVARLVSSGKFYNSVTLAFAPLPMEYIDHGDLYCD